jgi:hypothetical protein
MQLEKFLINVITCGSLVLMTGCTAHETRVPPPGYTVIPGCMEDCDRASQLMKSAKECFDRCYEIHYPP